MPLRALHGVPAPAKVNRFLHVVGRRDDGYHLLQSVFQLVDWCDTLHFERRDDGRLLRHDLTLPLPADDLVLRAARALQTAAGTPLGADIAVHKRIPAGAGLGGGSSDAATTLLALNRLWGLQLPRAQLLALALPLGADVPFFVGGRNAWVEGIGERLVPVELPRQWLAIVKPAASLPTAAVFGHRKLVHGGEAATLAGLLADDPGLGMIAAGWGRNDLQPPAEDLEPEVAQVAQWLTRRFGNSRMTGSGSAVFASAGTEDRPVATWPEAELPGEWVGRMCRSLDQHPLADWAG